MKKHVKLISALISIALLLTLVIVPVYAGFTPTEVTPDVTGAGTTSIKGIGNQVVGIIQIIGTIAAVAILIVVGIKYMMGSAEEKAEYKKTMIPYIIGAVLVFAAANLSKMLYDWAITLK